MAVLDRWNSEAFRMPDRRLPMISGCYAFLSGKRCLYVGKAVNLRHRFALHQWRMGYINYKPIPAITEPIVVKAIALPLGDIASFEKALIGALKPEMNVHFNRGLKNG